MKKSHMVIYEKKAIRRFIESKSQILSEYMEKSKSNFILYFKYLNHSDLPTFGKATKANSHQDNLLYYLKTEEMIRIERNSNKPFETAHQSNIALPKSFWIDLEIEDPRNTVKDPNFNKLLNSHINVYLVNEGLEFFSDSYTKLIFNKLEKSIKSSRVNEWESSNIDLDFKGEEFIEINITQAVHGIGTKEDIEFHKLRHHMFKNDILFFLIEKNGLDTNLFILPVKNPIFFTIIGQYNQAWERYKSKENQILINETSMDQNAIKESFDRKHQLKWRNLLAEEMMNYTTSDYEVFCPFTLIQTRFDELGTLFRASHIKGFKDCNEYEKYDTNNGLLLVANADALFDKHLISISEDKKLIFSFLIEQDHVLKQKLLLTDNLFKDVLNEVRMEYLNYHREIFYKKEEERKKTTENQFLM